MRIDAVEMRRVRMPLVTPFRTSFGTQTERDILLLRALTDGPDGWGECVALSEPAYSPEYVAGAVDVLRAHLIPALRGVADAHAVAGALSFAKGHRMAKAALEMALLDAQLRAEGRSLARELGSVHERIPCGVSVGIMDSIPHLLDAVGGYLDAGYARIKLKIEPGGTWSRCVRCASASETSFSRWMPTRRTGPPTRPISRSWTSTTCC